MFIKLVIENRIISPAEKKNSSEAAKKTRSDPSLRMHRMTKENLRYGLSKESNLYCYEKKVYCKQKQQLVKLIY